MRGAAMSLTAAASGFVVLLTVSVVQSQNDWGVTYTSTKICAAKGSTVNIRCSYRYPSTINNIQTTVQNRFWFSKMNGNEHMDLKTDPDYTGRVEYSCHENDCTLRIRDLRESDSAEYKFRFITNQQGGRFYGSPGVTLTVTDLQVKVRRSSTQTELQCHSSRDVADPPSYVWYKNGQKMEEETSSLRVSVRDDDSSYSCAVKGREDCHSAPVYAPKLPSVSVSPSAEIVEDSSVTLTCSSDANPAADYTWYKKNDRTRLSEEQQLSFSSIQSSDSGEYYCTAENELGRRTSESISIDVKYPPKNISVSVSPSGEIKEGTKVTLTCSSDANPAANYTWYKEESAKVFGQNFTITNITHEHSGNYYCEARNIRGRHNSTLQLKVLKGSQTLTAAVTVSVVLLALIIISVILCIIKNRSSQQQQPESAERPDSSEQVQPAGDDVTYASVDFFINQADAVYSNIKPAQTKRRKERKKEEEMVEYAAVTFKSASSVPRIQTTNQEAAEDPAALYSTVNKPATR